MKAISLALCLSAVIASAQPAPAAPPAQTAQQSALPTVAPLVETVKSAVVNVDVQARAPQAGVGDQLGELFEFFGQRGRPGQPGPRRQPLRQGAGSGFIIDPKGLVLTNNHVVEGAVSIRVRLDDGRSYDADVLGRDPLTDVALIKLKGQVQNLPVVRLGDSEALRVGDWVMAIGNPFGLASSVSVGIISAKARQIRIAGPYDDFLQTDAAINPGNSGGPLFNMRGEVIGINTAIVGSGTGIGFAVPSNLAKALLPQLEKEGSVTRAWLGIGIQDLTPDLAKALGVQVTEGAVVVQVNDGSPAKKAGLQVDDVIVSIDGEKVGSGNTLTRTVALKKPGSTSTLSLYRGGRQHQVKVQLGTRPDLEGIGQKSAPAESSEENQRNTKLGLFFQDMDPRMAESTGLPPRGAVITEVVPGSPAERAELQPGMVVTEVGKKPVANAQELLRQLKAAKPGTTVLLRLQSPGGGRALRALTIPGT